MRITLEEVEKVALLARLKLTSEEARRMTRELDSILDYVSKLAELDTTEVEPFRHGAGEASALRTDQVTNQPDVEALLANTPYRDREFFKVPKIIE